MEQRLTGPEARANSVDTHGMLLDAGNAGSLDNGAINARPHQLYEIQLNENMNLEDIYDPSEFPDAHYD